MTVTEAWAALGIAPTDDQRAVKRVYSGLLKQIDVDREPAEFIRLREALELALHYGAEIPEWERDDYGETAAWDEAEADHIHPNDEPEHVCENCGTGAWQPPAPPSGSSALASASQRLGDLLFDSGPIEPAEVEAAGAALLVEVDAAPVDEAAATERWLLGALVDSIPRSDPVIAPAIDHFGWDNAVRPRDYGFGYDIDTLRQRQTDAAKVDRLLASSVWEGKDGFLDKCDADGLQRALRELRKSGRSRVSLSELFLAADVRQFLDRTLVEHSTMEHDLDPGQVAFWREYFERRHLPGHFWAILVAAPLSLIALGWLTLELGGARSPISLATGFGIALAITLIGILAHVELGFRARERERAFYDLGYQSRRAEPWLVLSLVLPSLAALTPFGKISALGWTWASLAVAIGAFLSTRAPVREETDSMLGPRSLSVTTLIACAAVCFVLFPAGKAHALGPLLILFYVGHRGHEAAAISMRDLSPAVACAVIAVAGLLPVAAMAALFLFHPAMPPAALLMLVPVAAMAQHLATAHLFLDTRGIEWGSRIVGALFYFIAGLSLFQSRNDALIAAILLYVLLYSLARAIIALRAQPAAEEPPAYF